MQQPLTTARREALRKAVEANDRREYYRLLQSYGYNYGSMALGVVDNNTIGRRLGGCGRG